MYRCSFPGCDYMTDLRSQMANHHIIPKSMGGNDSKGNRVMVCPNCHTKIYVPNMKHGHHSKYTKDSIIILNKLYSTEGYVIEYKCVDDDGIHYTKSYE